MKASIIVLLIFTLLHIACTAYSEQIHVPLPDVEGRYYVDMSIPAAYYNRTMPVYFERTPITVDRVWIHFTGTISVGEIICDLEGDGTYETGPYVQSLAFGCSMKDTVNGCWYDAGAGLPDEDGTYEYTSEFRLILGKVSSWDFLKVGYITLYVNTGFGIFPECSIPIWPETTIETAELIVEGEFKVSTQESTWGGIKVLYR